MNTGVVMAIFPFGELIRIMRHLDPAAALSLEWEKQWHPKLSPVDDALEAFLATAATIRNPVSEASSSID